MRYVLAIVLAALLGAAYAKLPPPSPEEQAKAEKKKADDKAQGDQARKELEQAQDRVVRRYHERHPGTHASARADEDKVKASDVPAGAKQADVPHGK